MCGLFGVVTNKAHGFDDHDCDTFAANMMVNSWRGKDSTGIVLVDSNGGANAIKSVGGPWDLMRVPEFPAWAQEVKRHGKIAFGHGRWATRGKITVENAHPFHIKAKDGHELLFMHNGTLLDWQHLPHFKEYDVDSHWLGEMIGELGAKEVFSKVNGAVACQWWDEKEQAFFIYRNNERPLHLVCEKYNGTVHINSTVGALEWLVDTFTLNTTKQGIMRFSEETLYKFPLADPTNWTTEKIERYKPPYVATPPYTPPTYNHTAYSQQKVVVTRTPDREFIEHVKDLFAGRLGKVIWLPNGAKYTYNREEIVVGTYPLIDPPSALPHVRRIARLKLDDKQAVVVLDGATGSVIKTMTEQELIDWYEESAQQMMKYPGGIKPKSGDIIRWHGKATIDGKSETVKHKILCDRTNADYLDIYENQYDGVYEIGSRIMFEPYDFKRLGGKTDLLRVRGGLMTPKGGANITCELQTALFSQKEIAEEGVWCATIAGMRLTTGSERRDEGVGDIVFLMNHFIRAQSMNANDCALVQEQQNLTFDEAMNHMKTKA